MVTDEMKKRVIEVLNRATGKAITEDDIVFVNQVPNAHGGFEVEYYFKNREKVEMCFLSFSRPPACIA